MHISISTHAAISKCAASANIQRSADIQRSAIIQRSANTQRSANMQRSANVQRSADMQRSADIQRSANIQRSASIQRSAIIQRSANAQRSADAQRSAIMQRSANTQRSSPPQRECTASKGEEQSSYSRDRSACPSLSIWVALKTLCAWSKHSWPQKTSPHSAPVHTPLAGCTSHWKHITYSHIIIQSKMCKDGHQLTCGPDTLDPCLESGSPPPEPKLVAERRATLLCPSKFPRNALCPR
jgi:hypothetical protein